MTRNVGPKPDFALSPCPFCGGEAEHSEGRTGGSGSQVPWFYVECFQCGASAEPEFWNLRTSRPSGEPLRDSRGRTKGDPNFMHEEQEVLKRAVVPDAPEETSH